MYNKFTSFLELILPQNRRFLNEFLSPFPTVSFIAQSFGTTTDYLYGLTDDSAADTITISADSNPELFAYWQKINAEEPS